MANKVNTTANMKQQVSDAEIEKGVQEMVKILGEQPMKTLFIPEGLGVQNPLPVCINGAVMAIPVGKEVEVPESVYNLVMNESNVLRKNVGKTLYDETGLTVEQRAQSRTQ